MNLLPKTSALPEGLRAAASFNNVLEATAYAPRVSSVDVVRMFAPFLHVSSRLIGRASASIR